MPRVVPLNRTVEKAQIWNRYREPVGFKFYETFKETKRSEPEHGEFSVIESRRKNPRAMAFLVRSTIRRMLDGEIPPDVNYKCYDSFIGLHGLQWKKVHKVMYYNVQHTRT
jgi:hypothetical protein